MYIKIEFVTTVPSEIQEDIENMLEDSQLQKQYLEGVKTLFTEELEKSFNKVIINKLTIE